jgi:hypothetical protein
LGLSYNFGKTAGAIRKRNTGGAENEKAELRINFAKATGIIVGQ